MSFVLITLCILPITPPVASTITEHFREFVAHTYDVETARLLARDDLSVNASFGGIHDDDLPTKQPVVFVHGVMSTASKFFPIRKFFAENGYTNSEMYATSWGDPELNLISVSVECAYVKQIRSLIRAVHAYTRKRMDIIAFSLGSVITRKAIYGGMCDGENLGLPVTRFIDTFVSVAGPNRGSSMCESFGNVDVCNPFNGISCDSSLLYELNTGTTRYEGTNSFAIYSLVDEKIGNECCGEKCGSLVHSNREFTHFKLPHDRLLYSTAKLQYDLVTKHRPMPRRRISKAQSVNATVEAASFNDSDVDFSELHSKNMTLLISSTGLTLVLYSFILLVIYCLRF